MNFLPYTDLPLTHQARAYTPSDRTDIAKSMAEFVEQHTPILVCPLDDEYAMEKTQ